MNCHTLVQHADSRDSAVGRIAAVERIVGDIVFVSINANFDDAKG